MADETTPTTSDQQLSQIIAQLLSGRTAPPTADPNTGPSSREGRGFASLLGEGIGGGARYGSTPEREQGGLAALGALGARMLQASDWSVMPHTFGSILGQGLEAARGSLGQTQAVSAARQQAAQQYAHEQQQDQIARLKEALPYLQLQEEQRAAARQRELLKPENKTSIGTGGSIGTAGDYTVPADLLPIYKAEAERTGVPVELLIAQHKQESNLNPGATGGAGEVGLGQILPSTAKSPGFGMAGVDPGALRTPAANIRFSADYLAARAKAAGADFKTPEGTVKALRAYNGGGDPNYAQNVLRYVPGAQKALAGGAARPAPAPGQAASPPPEPPLLAGTAQTAGDAAPTGDVIPPSPPGSAATVAAIEAGRASSPARTTGAPQPGAVVTAQAGGQPALPPPPPIKAGEGYIVHPGVSYQEFFKREAVPPPQTEDFNPNLTARQNAAFAHEAAAIEKRAESIAAGRVINQKDVADIRSAREELKAKVELAAQEKARKAAENTTKWTEKQEDTIRPRYEQMIKSYDDAAKANLTHSQAMALKEKEGEISRLNTEAGSIVQSNKEIRDQLGKDSVASAGRHQNLEGLLALSDNVSDKNTTLQSLATIKYGGKSLLDHMATFGVIPRGDAGPIQMLQSGISGAITELRAGVQMGALSDRDLSFIESQGPSLYEDQATRTAVIKYLQQAARAKMKFNTIYNEEMTRTEPNGRPVSSAVALERARDILEKKYPIVPLMTQGVADVWDEQTPEAAAARKKWAKEYNVKARSLVRRPNGSLVLVD